MMCGQLTASQQCYDLHYEHMIIRGFKSCRYQYHTVSWFPDSEVTLDHEFNQGWNEVHAQSWFW